MDNGNNPKTLLKLPTCSFATNPNDIMVLASLDTLIAETCLKSSSDGDRHGEEESRHTRHLSKVQKNRKDCEKHFDIWLLVNEKEEWLQSLAVKSDMKELEAKVEESKVEEQKDL